MTEVAGDTGAAWTRVLASADLAEGRVTTVVVGRRSLALARSGGVVGALDNRCPHQGGPLGEGSIEQGWLRCPWHGYDYSPLTGRPPEGFSDAPACFPARERDGWIEVDVPPAAPHVRTVSDLIVETLVAWGLTHVFGMVGHSNLGLADALRRAEQRGDLTYVAIRHEGAAAFAASAFGKLTGRVAACFAIAGPGSTNLLTGLYDAKEDRVPILALSGQVPSAVRGRGAFQDTDLEAAFSGVATFSETVQLASDHSELAALAMKHALVDRRVSHLILPDEVQTVPVGDAAVHGPAGRSGDPAVLPASADLDAAEALLRRARRPVVVVGRGAHGHMGGVLALAERLGAPVLTTFKGKGLVADDHPLGAGVLGRSGTPVASWMMNEADLLLVLGASFSNHTGIADYKPTIQVDRDPMALGRFHPVDRPVLGDITRVTSALDDRLAVDPPPRGELAGHLPERWAIWREEKRRRAGDGTTGGISAAAAITALARQVADDAVIAVDVGNNTYAFGRYFEASGRQDVLMSGYLGSIGFALPAALGAWAATGGARQVVSLSGDGGFGQYAMELTTAVRHGMAITHVVLSNGELGKISKEQRAADHEVWQTALVNPDLAAFARLCGAHGERVEDAAGLDAALRRALDHPGPALVEVMTDALLV
jgi:thiamine pyrophosphate-dependent acetolactate synthase large subunit-like protein/nitrite reductase/ring-hydroxylating ferredoxin subunit